MTLSLQRKQKYDDMEAHLQQTPLIEIDVTRFGIPKRKNNRIFAKLEYENPFTGSHYDRYWVRLLRKREESGVINPDWSIPLLETTTGNSGAAFAWACRELRYKCEVYIPEDMPQSRIKQIRHYGAKVLFSPEREYVDGLIKFFRKNLSDMNDMNKKYFPIDHARDTTEGVWAIHDLGLEISADFRKLGYMNIDIFVSALGNGLTTRWIGSALKEKHNTQIIGVEPYESPSVLQKVFPQKFKDLGFDDNYFDTPHVHCMYGTGPGVTDFVFPNMQYVIDNRMLKDILLIKPEEWKQRDQQLHSFLQQDVGHTSAACFDAAIKIAKDCRNKNILLIFYDRKWKYTNDLPREFQN